MCHNSKDIGEGGGKEVSSLTCFCLVCVAPECLTISDAGLPVTFKGYMDV